MREKQVEWEDVIEVTNSRFYFREDGTHADTFGGKIEWVKVGDEVIKLIRPLDGNKIAVMRYGLRDDPA